MGTLFVFLRGVGKAKGLGMRGHKHAMQSGLRFGSLAVFAALAIGCNKVDFQGATEKASILCDSSTNSCPEVPVDPGSRLVQEEVTVQNASKIDILFVVDDSGSMAAEQRALGSRLSEFISSLGGLDWNICLTTTDATDYRGRLLRFDDGSYVLSSSNSNANSVFLDTLTSLPRGSGHEEGIRAMNLAFQSPDSRCFRSDAALAAIVLSDEDEQSTGGYDQFRNSNQFVELVAANYPQSVVQTVAQSFGSQKVFTAHSIVIRSGDTTCYDAQERDSDVWYGTRYEQLSSLTGGIVGNICADDYTEQLKNFASRIESSVASVNLQCTPVGQPSVEIIPQIPGVQASVIGNKIAFSPALPAGTRVKLGYACPN